MQLRISLTVLQIILYSRLMLGGAKVIFGEALALLPSPEIHL